MTDNLDVAIKAAIAAGKKILEIYELPDVGIAHKDDDSPLTLADTAANSCIMGFLNETAYPIISEENKQLDYSLRNQWPACWIVDPLDGTKEFIKKNGEFTVNIALCAENKPKLGVIYVPVTRELYYGDVEKNKAYKAILDDDHNFYPEEIGEKNRIEPAISSNTTIRVVGSRSHMNQETLDFIESVKKTFDDVVIVSKGSSLKFCLLAEGKADVYPRFAPTMEWDTAAGQAICNAVGLKVISKETDNELSYNKENLLNPYFLVSK